MWKTIVQYGVPALKYSGRVVGTTLLGIATYKTAEYTSDKAREWNHKRKTEKAKKEKDEKKEERKAA